jgi:predicted RNA-binding Zn-ribbon protein involved in translation (DUF1610 family)
MTHSDMTGMTAGGLSWPLLDRQDGNFRLAHYWPVPSVRLDGERLCYERFGEGTPRLVKDPSIKLLTGFLGLADASPGEIERHATHWGVLCFCQHNAQGWPLVLGHEFHPDLGNYEPCRPLFAEALESWRRYARAFRALLDQATALRKRRRLRPRSKRADDELNKFLLSCDFLVRYFGCLSPRLVVENGKFDIKLSGRFISTGLPAALVTQLLFTLASASGFGTCSSCGRLFALKRRPQKGKNSYCPDCGIRAAWREAQQRRRVATKQNDKQR